MKKLISLMLVLALCLSTAVVAGAVPSKSTSDLTEAEVTVNIENKPGSSNAFIAPVVTPDSMKTDEEMTEEEKEEFQKQQEQYQAQIDICNQEISKLVSLVQTAKATSLEEKIAEKGEEAELDEVEAAAAQTAAIESFFTDVKNSEGEQVTLKQMLGVAEDEEAQLDVSEFFPITAGGFDENSGKVVANMSFATTYEKDEKVVVLIGVVKTLDDGTTQIVWTALEGLGQDNGDISVELPSEVVMAIQDGTAIMSVVRNVSGK